MQIGIQSQNKNKLLIICSGTPTIIWLQKYNYTSNYF